MIALTAVLHHLGRIADRVRRSESGASAVEMALIAPVLIAAIGLGLFAAHIHEVKSDLQRAAQRTARYGAIRCDYRGNYGPTSGCTTGDYRSMNELVAYANDNFGGDVSFVDLSSGTCELGAQEAVLCRTFDPSTPAGPVTNQRVRVTLKYRYETPLAPFLRVVGAANALVDLHGRGEATVE